MLYLGDTHLLCFELIQVTVYLSRTRAIKCVFFDFNLLFFITSVVEISFYLKIKQYIFIFLNITGVIVKYRFDLFLNDT